MNELEIILKKSIANNSFIQCIEKYSYYDKSFTDILIKIYEEKCFNLLDICNSISIDSTALDHIDFIICKELDDGNYEICIQSLEIFYKRYRNEFKIFQLNKLISKLHHNQKFLLEIVTRWFLSKKYYLYKAATDLILKYDIPHFDISYLGSQGDNVYPFLAKKICGWLFKKPKKIISLIDSIFDKFQQEQLNGLHDLIFNVLILNYPKNTCDTLTVWSESSNNARKTFARNLLSKYKTYIENIAKASHIKELKVSEINKFLNKSYQEKLIKEGIDNPKNQGLISSLFPTQILLYGNSSIYHIYQDNKTSRHETVLSEHTISIEVPIMSFIAPTELEILLYSLKYDECD